MKELGDRFVEDTYKKMAYKQNLGLTLAGVVRTSLLAEGEAACWQTPRGTGGLVPVCLGPETRVLP